MTRSAVDRILSRAHPGPGGCLLWDGFIAKNGYGRITVAGRPLYVHRVIYAEMVGAVPEDHEVHHRCEVRSCVNHEHLQALTRAEHNRLHGGLVTSCVHGHEYTPKNTRWTMQGRRKCRACERAAGERRRADPAYREAARQRTEAWRAAKLRSGRQPLL